MRRPGAILALVAMVAAGSACAVDEYRDTLDTCQDMNVGETQRIDASGYLAEIDDYEWELDGPGVLTPRSVSADYEATDPGTARLRYEGWEVDELGLWALPIGGARVVASCSIEVSAASAAPSTTAPPAAGYAVTAIVTESTVEGLTPVGLETTATWQLVFECDDGRCDAEVIDGGPFGGLPPFVAVYDAANESYAIDFVLDTPDNPDCGDDRWVGEILPTGWDTDGPVEFSWSLVNHLVCDPADVVIEWEGAGTR
jgi:hypothetical protein